MSLAMPSRSRAWSSTVRTRITISSCLPPEQLQTRPSWGFAISHRGWNAQIDLRAFPSAAPDVQLAARLSGALMHSGEAVVAGAAGLQDVGRDTVPVIPNAHPEKPLTIGNFGFDPAGP